MSIIKGDSGVNVGDFGVVITEINGMRLKRPFRVYQLKYTDAEILDAVYEATGNIGKMAGNEMGMAQERMTLTEDERSVFARLLAEAEDEAGMVLLPYMSEHLESYKRGDGEVLYVIKQDVGAYNNNLIMMDDRVKWMIEKYIIWKWMVDAAPGRSEMCREEYEEAKREALRVVDCRGSVGVRPRPF